MAHYELMVIYSPDLEEEDMTAAKERIQQVIANHGGELGEIDDMGKRRLAYEIDDYRDGVYQVINFDTEDPTVVDELDRVIKIDDRYMRHLTVNMTRDRKE